jgi:hypothetical protein
VCPFSYDCIGIKFERNDDDRDSAGGDYDDDDDNVHRTFL